MQKVKTYSSVIIAMFFFSMSFIWYKEAYIFYRPFATIFLRLLISSGLLWILLILSGKFRVVLKNDIKLFLLLALFEPFLYFVGESYGIMYVSSTLSSIIISTIPVFTTLVGVLFIREKFSFLNACGVIMSFMGIVLVVFSQEIDLYASLKGILLMLLAVSGAIGYAFVIVHLTEKYSPLQIVTIQNTLGAIYFLPLFLIFEFRQFTGITHHWTGLTPILKLSVFASTIAFLMFTFSIQKLGVARATLFTNIIPAITAVAAFIMLKEPMPMLKITGLSVAIAGLFISQVNFQIFSQRVSKKTI